MNIEQRLQSARRAIVGYTNRLAAFENGTAIPQIGELIGTRRLLNRKQRQLRAMETTREVLLKNVRVTYH